MKIETIGACHRRCPNECRPVGAAVIAERGVGHRVTRRLSCPNCGVNWTQHRFA